MGVPFSEAEKALDDAVKQLFASDPTVCSVGIGRHGDDFGFRAVRNAAMIMPLTARLGAPIYSVQNVPVTFARSHAEISSLARVPHSGPGSPGVSSLVLEQNRYRGLYCGLQIENYDDDVRTGEIAGGFIIIGTLGCFVTTSTQTTAILSNNHVVGGQNRGVKGTDRILQPGSFAIAAGDEVAVLTDFITLNPSPPGASPGLGTAILNDVDAGIASLVAGVAFTQGYLPTRGLVTPNGTAVPSVGDTVFKVGRTTGLTRGTITDVATTVGPVGYDPGPCWFRRSITIEGLNGTMFSDHGDSGSAILKDTGEVVGLLYAGNGTQTYACPIDMVLTALNCRLA